MNYHSITTLLLLAMLMLPFGAKTLALEWEAMPEPGRPAAEVLAAWQAAAGEQTERPAAPEPAEEEEAAPTSWVAADLRWFQRHQSADGSWSATGHPQACTLDGPKVEPDLAQGAWGVGWPERDVLLTSGSVLVYLGAGYDHRTPSRYRRVVAPALDYLVQRVDAEAPPLVHHHTRALVAMALAEAYAMTNDPDLREPAQRAVDALLATALTSGEGAQTVGWAASAGERVVDLPATLLAAMAIRSAEAGNLQVGSHLADLRHWLSGLLREGAAFLHGAGRSDICLPQRASVTRDRLYGEASAVGLMLAGFLNLRKQEEPRLSGLADRVMDQWYPYAASDPFQRYAASIGIFIMGDQRWPIVNEVQRNALVHSQIHSDDCRDGSWPAHPDLDASIGSSAITATILSALTLQVYYRYEGLSPE